MTDTPKARRPRSDGQRSRLALLAAARSAFMAGESDIRMDAIASRAGVGVGTLYRHFADRSALIEAVYADERDQLVASAPVLAASHEPLEALRQWMQLFVAYAATKKIMTPVLETVTGGAASLHECSGAPIIDAMQRLTSACVAAGVLRDDIDPMDMLRAVYGVCTIAGDRPQQAIQFIDIVLAGARPGVTP